MVKAWRWCVAGWQGGKIRLRSILAWTIANAEAIVVLLAFAAVTIGWYLAWAPLGFIVPGSLVLTAFVYKWSGGKGPSQQGSNDGPA